jgi:hypothetical protein
MLSQSGVAEQYKRVCEDRMKGNVPPRADAIQQLVAAWYRLWKWGK